MRGILRAASGSIVTVIMLCACAGQAASPSASDAAAPGTSPSETAPVNPCELVPLGDDPLTIEVTARSFVFDTDRIEGPRECEPFVIVLLNHEGDSPTTPEDRMHGFGIRTENLLGDVLFEGERTPPGDTRYEVPGLPAGEHYFYCTNHSDMNGTLVVTQ